ncbi:hypothetical protein, variant 1 [Aphanomyces astaci]|uniref:Sugar phosphate transporter domain-containing protein n=1 Tax=Aphanomyces astaci TaxID=112090 RepID=W4FY64_APHAT|nr:hypothetical protein, variant 1 [Aphanomyces astaci]ETV71583.1 hypothetical protein, variant 1 [Aphanomyces astaci]|eukprot:XP_009838774.1 hypothetical protein, variant 1 [Aphanomyces astaci]
MRSSSLHVSSLSLSDVMHGVCSFNAGFWAMHVSINETLRALEPLVSVVLASTCLRDPQLSRLRLLALVPIVTGVYLSAISNGAFSIVGMIITMVANIAFPLRAALVKRLQPFMSLHVMFYSTLYYAMLLQWLLAGLWSIFGSQPASSRSITSANFKELVFALVNGAFFYLYHWCSFVVLSSTDMVSHAVWNALRRVTTILFSVWYFGLALHRMNALGMVVACTGALVYAKTLRWERQTSQLLGSLLKETHQIV